MHCTAPSLFCGMGIQKSTFTFLRAIAKNNNRDWFAENKAKYQAAHADVVSFMGELLTEYGKYEAIPEQDPKKSIFRIYRDVRFSKNKDPYKTNFAGMVHRGPGRISLYVNISPGGKSMIGGGIWQPSPQLLAAVRQEIDYNGAALKKILSRKAFKDNFGAMQGETLKTAPKGYPKDHEHIELLRHKSFVFFHELKDAELTDTKAAKSLVSTYKKAKDFVAFFDAPMMDVHEKNS